jgi:hypothetical protein
MEIDLTAVQGTQAFLSRTLVQNSTLSTFFAAVAVTALQMSVNTTGTHLENAVNVFFFTSLFCSVSCAVTSSFALNIVSFEGYFFSLSSPASAGLTTATGISGLRWPERVVFLNPQPHVKP